MQDVKFVLHALLCQSACALMNSVGAPQLKAKVVPPCQKVQDKK